MSAVREALHKAAQREDLSEAEALAVMNEILSGPSTPTLIGALLVALSMKGETVDEIVGFARAMRSQASRIPCKTPASELVDTCGTGGDGSHSFQHLDCQRFRGGRGGGACRQTREPLDFEPLRQRRRFGSGGSQRRSYAGADGTLD